MAVTPVQVSRPLALTFPDLSGLKRILSHRRIVIGFCILLPVIALAVVAPVRPLPGPLETNPIAGLQGPSSEHLLGTDKIGRDVLSRVLTGARTSLFVGFVVSVLAVSIGTVLGTCAGFMGR